MGHTHLVLVRLVVGNLVAVLASVIISALDFIPQVSVAGHAIAVIIHTHHDDARFATATGHAGHGLALHGVAIDFNVIAMHIHHRMVKAKNDVTAIAAQADRAAQLSAQGILQLRVDAVLGISGLVGRENVNKLSWRGQIIIYPSDVG